MVISSPVHLQPNVTGELLEISQRASPLILPEVVEQNANSATVLLDHSKPDDLSSTYIVYNVPGTSTRLIISVLDQTLLQVHMGGVILKAINYVDRRIRSHPEDRNSSLDRQDDPFWRESDPPGTIFGAWSINSKRLTYEELGRIAFGVWKAMYGEGKYNGATIDVRNKEDGGKRIGYAVIKRGHLTPRRAES
ncbi:MAG: hypothetical protein Q9209_004866 [Squamulea sp. 1 TL-2023]